MSFSTWRQDFGEHKQPAFRLAVLVAGVAGVPIVMLAALEVAYLLSYPACWHGYRWALYAAVLTALVPVAIVGWLLRRHHPRLATAEAEPPWSAWLAAVALLGCGYFAITILSMLVPAIGLAPCR